MTRPANAHPTDTPAMSRPGRPAYLTATKSFNLAARVHPAEATTARSTAEVVGAIHYARRVGLPVRVVSTGHGATGKALPAQALMIRTTFDAPVRVDPSTRTATIPAGATWEAVVHAAAHHDLIAVHGSSGEVGAVGYLLRGGISFYGRAFGLGVNSLRSITLVLASGQIVVTSDDTHPDLFWALRGGGGGFGVVTEVTIDLHPMSALVTGATVWDATDAAAIATYWGRWTENAPRGISTSLRLMNLPPLPGVPASLTTGQILVIDGAVTVESTHDQDKAEAIATDLLAPLRELAAPIMDTWHTGAPSDLLQTHMDPPEPMPYAGNHTLLGNLADEGIARFLEAAGPGSGTTLTMAELRQLGGRFADPPQPGGAFDRVSAPFAYLAIGAFATPSGAAAVTAELEQVGAAMAPWDTRMTIPSAVESYDAVQRTFSDETATAVDLIRTQVDPDGVFRGDVEAIRDTIDPFSAGMEARVSDIVLGDKRHGLTTP